MKSCPPRIFWPASNCPHIRRRWICQPTERANWALPSAQDSSLYISLANALSGEHPREFPSPASLPIILGNPPYAGHSLNHSAWLGSLLESYKVGDAGLKKPAQTKWLSDDYVQFLRLAQWQVEQAGRGIVAFLTSHSYLDNPTFRGMRLSLLHSFDEIYILDLHGNSKRRELAPGGIRDHNIFPIQQGIALGFFVKHATDGRKSTWPRSTTPMCGVRKRFTRGRKRYAPFEWRQTRLVGQSRLWAARPGISASLARPFICLPRVTPATRLNTWRTGVCPPFSRPMAVPRPVWLRVRMSLPSHGPLQRPRQKLPPFWQPLTRHKPASLFRLCSQQPVGLCHSPPRSRGRYLARGAGARVLSPI